MKAPRKGRKPALAATSAASALKEEAKIERDFSAFSSEKVETVVDGVPPAPPAVSALEEEAKIERDFASFPQKATETIVDGAPAAPPPAPRLAMSEMPTIGRIVVVLGRQLGTPAPDSQHGQHMTAIVTRVRSASVVDLTVFPPGAPSLHMVAVQNGKAPGDWLWPRELPED